MLADRRAVDQVVVEQAIIVDEGHADERRDEPLADLVVPRQARIGPRGRSGKQCRADGGKEQYGSVHRFFLCGSARGMVAEFRAAGYTAAALAAS